MTSVRFEIDRGTLEQPAAADVSNMVAFYEAKYSHYELLRRKEIPGTAWFRHQADAARMRLKQLGVDEPGVASRWGFDRTSSIEDTYALLSGGRAVSENLQLDRVMAGATDMKESLVPVESIEGISVHEFDWKELIKELNPEVDPLASMIPEDQHAVFFPSFQAMIDLIDRAEMSGEPILTTLQPRAEKARVRERYERQLALPLDALGRAMGPQFIESVAVTGSDPYMRTGTDVAVLFEAKNVVALTSAIALRITAAQSTPEAEAMRGNVDGVPYVGARTADRSICTYMATLGSTVVVTNSIPQLERLIAAYKNEVVSLDELDEYTFFRDRYDRTDPDETAFIMLSDATIRRWCGPRWRIGTSRRTRAVAAMTDFQARYLNDLARGAIKAGPIHGDASLGYLGDLSLTAHGVESSLYGSLEFQTPIVELELDRVSRAEADQYEQWRTNYERNWRNAFDPIAVRLTTNSSSTEIDMSVIPLIAGSEYGEIVTVTRGASIAPNAGDPHAKTMMHWIMAINKDSEPMQQMSSAARMFAPTVKIDLLAWLGESVAIYVEEDPMWDELAQAEDPESFLEENFPRMPIALHVAVGDGVRLTAFLAAARNYIEGAAPDMTVWETHRHNNRSYVAIAPSEDAKSGSSWDDLKVYYVATGQALIITPNEELLKRAIDRQTARRNAKRDGVELERGSAPWLGRSLSFQADHSILPMIDAVFGDDYQARMQTMAWGNLVILNEWKRRFPDLDPVQLHRSLWQTEIVCPGAGELRWNDEWQTMESSIYGHPGEPATGSRWPDAMQRIDFINAGLTFEHEGLRARVSLQEKTPEN
jgi:hypothetical protein